MKFPNPLLSIIDLVFPELCPGCISESKPEESLFCIGCTLEIPYSKILTSPFNNSLKNKFDPALNIHFALSLYTMDVDSSIEQLIRQLKYHNRAHLGFEAGVKFAEMIQTTGFDKQIDILIPVPLHKKRELKRGYNQSERICTGMSSFLGIPIDTDSLVRIKNTKTQTAMTKHKRTSNMASAFRLRKNHDLTGKHVCIVDDVITTGSTITACIQILKAIPGIRFSIASLALPLE